MPEASQPLSFWCDFFSFKRTALVSYRKQKAKSCVQSLDKGQHLAEKDATIKSIAARLVYKLASPAQGVPGSLPPLPAA